MALRSVISVFKLAQLLTVKLCLCSSIFHLYNLCSLMYVVFGISAISCRTIIYFETPKFICMSFQVNPFKDDFVWFASQEALEFNFCVCKSVNVVIAYLLSVRLGLHF